MMVQVHGQEVFSIIQMQNLLEWILRAKIFADVYATRSSTVPVLIDQPSIL